MRKYTALTLISLAVLAGIIFVFNHLISNRQVSENQARYENIRQKEVRDSINEVRRQLDNIALKRNNETADSLDAIKKNIEDSIQQKKKEEYEIQANLDKINSYTAHLEDKLDVAILILNDNSEQVNSLASEVSRIFHSKGYSTSNSFFTNVFLRSEYLNELETGSSQIIDMLSLPSRLGYIIIGRYNYDFVSGEYTKFVCNGSLDLKIISCTKKRQIDGFKLVAANAFDDKAHAESGVEEKIIGMLVKKNIHF